MEVDEEEEEEEDGANVPQKRQKVLERCRFWPVCKSGDECPYHHPTTQCKYVAGEENNNGHNNNNHYK